jgi:hypothetical protein
MEIGGRSKSDENSNKYIAHCNNYRIIQTITSLKPLKAHQIKNSANILKQDKFGSHLVTV